MLDDSLDTRYDIETEKIQLTEYLEMLRFIFTFSFKFKNLK